MPFRSWLSLVLLFLTCSAWSAVSSEVSRTDYVGSGSLAAYSTTFPCKAVTEVRVFKQDADGQDVELTYGADYSAVINGSGLVTITLTAGNLTNGYKLSLQRGIPYTQTVTPGAAYNAATMATALDRLAMEMVRLKGDVDRAIKLPYLEAGGDTVTKLETPAADRVGQSIVFGSSGEAMVGATVDGVVASVFAQTLLDDTTADATRTTLGLPSQAMAARTVVANDTNGAANGTATTIDSLTVLSTGGATRRSLAARFATQPNIRDFGAVGDGTTLDDTAFGLAAASGKKVILNAGETYYLASGKTMVSGGGFICSDGFATIKLKTGSGGFNITNTGGTRTDLDRCVFSCVTVDNIDFEGLKFTTDAVAEKVIYPIRTSGGMGTNGIRIKRIRFTGLSGMSGGLISLNTVGAGSYVIDDVHAISCGTAQGSAYWTGSMQISIIEIDNDMVASTPSVHGFIRNIYGKDILLSGTALTNYGQQTDGINIAGISGTDQKGPVIDGVFLDGIGEGLDLFCGYATGTNIVLRNTYNYGVKLIHGARHNHIQVASVENFGLAAVILAGSSSLSVETEYNMVEVGSIRVSASYGAPTAETAAILFSDNSGGSGTCLPKNNIVRVGNVVGDSSVLKYVVRDGGADDNNNNLVEVGKASGWATAFCSAVPDNEKIFCMDGTEVELTLGSAQAITPATPTKVDFSVAAKDSNSEADTANDKVRCKFPGRKLVKGQVRVVSLSAGNLVELRILKNATSVAQEQSISTGTGEVIIMVEKVIYVKEDEVSAAGADISIQIEITSAGSPTLTQNAALSHLQVTDLNR